MSNVHRVGDYQAPPDQRGQAQPQQQRINMFGTGGDGGNSPYPPINKVLMPNFNRRTFIFVITVIQITMFIVELMVGGIWKEGKAFDPDNEMAGPDVKTMQVLGGKYLPCIQSGQIFRFLTPAVLHAGILHIFTNLVSQTMIGYTCELQWGTKRMIGFYTITAFGASLMSCVGSPCVTSVGASGALLGILGAQMTWVLLNWHNTEQMLGNPCQRMCTLIIWLFIIFMIGASTKGIDNLAHFGGWLTGILVGFAFHRSVNPVGWLSKYVLIVRYVFLVLTVFYFLMTLIASFALVSTTECGKCLTF